MRLRTVKNTINISTPTIPAAVIEREVLLPLVRCNRAYSQVLAPTAKIKLAKALLITL
jgi:hypothetical protein